MVEAKVWG